VINVLQQASENMELALLKLRHARKVEAASKAQVVGLGAAQEEFLRTGDVTKYSLDVSAVIAAYNKAIREA
jgi:negative regulator of sigma E activity